MTGTTAYRRVWQLALAGLILAVASPAPAQYFGRNKVRYQSFDFKILQTDNFEVYFYPEEADAVAEVGRMAERWHGRLSRLLDHDLSSTQPLIIYASHPQFEQTNAISGLLSESTGGVTEAFKRRIVLPFGGPLGSTDHVVGHELVHAFQYDIAGSGESLSTSGLQRLPLWFIEGMAEYLSIGPFDPHTAMWLRDAAREDKLPGFSDLSNPRYFPYRYGQAFLAFVAGHYGDDKMGKLLKAAVKSGDLRRSMRAVLGAEPDSLATAWHDAIHAAYDPLIDTTRDAKDYGPLVIGKESGGGSLNIAPALSPDGKYVVFFSEKDLFAINLFLADAETGQVLHTIIRAERDPHLESLQFINSAGAWRHDGKRIAFATVTKGRPALGILDVERRKIIDKIRFDELGEILNPTWSPDTRHIAFSAMAGGFTDLFIYDLDSGELRRMTDDPFTDIQPAWSPDGTRIAFSTDRFSADLETLDTGHLELALLDPRSGTIVQQPAFADGKHINPSWSPDGHSLYFLSDGSGITNIYRMQIEGGAVFQVTNLYTGVSGITAISPALASASSAERLAYCAYENGSYTLYRIDDAETLVGDSVSVQDLAGAALASVDSPAWLPPAERTSREVFFAVRNATANLPQEVSSTVKPYRSRFSLDFVGQPFLAGGTGNFGLSLGGGAAFFWSDMLGNQNLVTGIQVQSNGSFTDVGGVLSYQNTRRRWNWGATLQQVPLTYDEFAAGIGTVDSVDAYIEQIRHVRQTVRTATTFASYPFSRASRFDVGVGYENISFDDELQTFAQDLQTGGILINETEELPAPSALDLFIASTAYVHDFSFYGVTSPILGERYRLEVSPVVGSLNYFTVLTDYRRYFMPKRPFTFAFRGMHFGRYGSDGESDRLRSLFLGYQTLVRGYDSGSFSADECATANGDPCPDYNQLFGTRMAVANAELRFPLLGVLGIGSGYYGILPLETAVFFDAGVAWTRDNEAQFLGGDRDIVRSVGASMRLGLSRFAVLNIDIVNPLDRPKQKWFWQFSLTPGF